MAFGSVNEIAPPKINLFLHVGEKGVGGFHALQSLAVFGQAGDRLAAASSETLTLSLAGPFAVGLSATDNLVLKAANALGMANGAQMILEKNLPVASGIGGGSADAAAALRALCRLWNVARSDLANIAATLGSDVPVCLLGKPALMEGRGEIVTPVAALPRLSLLLINPGVPVATRDIFARLTTRRGIGLELPAKGFTDLADLLRFLEKTGNDLEAPALSLVPSIGEVLAALKASPGALFTRMSGSGATCFGIFPDDASAARAGATLKQQQSGWWVHADSVAEVNIVHREQGRDFAPRTKGA